jgi:hypothetical protein
LSSTGVLSSLRTLRTRHIHGIADSSAGNDSMCLTYISFVSGGRAYFWRSFLELTSVSEPFQSSNPSDWAGFGH